MINEEMQSLNDSNEIEEYTDNSNAGLYDENIDYYDNADLYDDDNADLYDDDADDDNSLFGIDTIGGLRNMLSWDFDISDFWDNSIL